MVAVELILGSASACGGIAWLGVEEWDGEEYVLEDPLGGTVEEQVVPVAGEGG